jgi:iron complex outermembrane recepter protein
LVSSDHANSTHIDLRNVTRGRDANIILANNWNSRTGTLPNGAPTGGIFSDLIERDPVTGVILNVNALLENVNRVWTEGLDYAASYQLDTSMFGHGNLGTFTFSFNGNYLDRFVEQAGPTGLKVNFNGRIVGPRFGSFPRNRWYASLFYDLGGLDTGLVVHYVGQYWDNDKSRKIREWTTLDLVVNYTFHLPQPATEPVPGYAKDGGKNAEMEDGKDKNAMPVSTAEYSSSGWRAWLNNTTITLGMNNVFDQDPPFTAFSVANGYDQWQANIRGRTWYVALTKRF